MTRPAAAPTATAPRLATQGRRGSWWWGVLVVLIAIAAGIGAYVVVRDQSGNGSAASSAAGLPPASDAAVTASDFDPLGDDGSEDAANVANVVDGDPGTWWSTSHYVDFTALKAGVGIRLTLDPESAIDAVTVSTRQSGWSASIYTSVESTGLGSIADWGEPVANGTDLQQTHTFTIDPPRGGRAVLVWFTALPPGPDGEQLDVTEVRLG